MVRLSDNLYESCKSFSDREMNLCKAHQIHEWIKSSQDTRHRSTSVQLQLHLLIHVLLQFWRVRLTHSFSVSATAFKTIPVQIQGSTLKAYSGNST